MNVTIKSGKFLKNYNKLSASMKNAIFKELTLGALTIEKDAKESIQAGGKTGKVYKRKSVTHRASAPGEAPASDTGRLVSSIRVEPDFKNGAVRIKAGSGAVKYAAMLEFGTMNMEARPFFQPAFAKNKRKIKNNVNIAIKREAKKNGVS